MNLMYINQQFKISVIYIAFLSLFLFLPFIAKAAWSSPTSNPPGGNADAPINTGSSAQVKNGSLSVDGIVSYANNNHFYGALGQRFTIRPGYRGSSQNGSYTTFEMPGTDTLFIWDNLEVSSDLLVNDIRHSNNERILYGDPNAYTYLYYNGAWKTRTEGNGLRVNGNLRATRVCAEDNSNCVTANQIHDAVNYSRRSFRVDDKDNYGTGWPWGTKTSRVKRLYNYDYCALSAVKNMKKGGWNYNYGHNCELNYVGGGDWVFYTYAHRNMALRCEVMCYR